MVAGSIAAAAAPIPMTGGREASFRASPTTNEHVAKVKFTQDRAIDAPLHDIGCPEKAPTLRIEASGGFDPGAIPLPCELIVGDDVDWRRHGFLGVDPRRITPSLDELAARGVTCPAGHLSASVWPRASTSPDRTPPADRFGSRVGTLAE
jgi:hypothetical protein